MIRNLINQLANETLSAVFIFALGLLPCLKADNLDQLEYIGFIKACSLVSKQWRSILLATPDVWTFVPVNFHPIITAEMPNEVEAWLIRSGALAIDIVIYDCSAGADHSGYADIYNLELPQTLVSSLYMLENSPHRRCLSDLSSISPS